MNHDQVMIAFYNIFRVSPSVVDTWFMHGKNTVRVRFKDKELPEIMFTYNGNKDFTIESSEAYLRRMRNK